MRKETEGGIGNVLGLKRVLAANLAIFALVGWGLAGEYLRNRDMQKEIDLLDGQASALEQRNGELKEAGERFGSAAVLEREARLKLNLQKPGENVVVVRDVKVASGSDGEDGAAGDADDGGGMTNAAKWWHYFFR
jgi:cell division protein FtsB